MLKPVNFFTKSSIHLIPKKKNLSSNMLPLVTVPLIAYLTPSGELTDAGKEILSKNYSSHFISFTSENNLSETTHGIENIAGVNSELDSSELASNISISDIGHAIGSEFVSEVETIGHTVADVPLLESVYGLSLLIKAKDPLVDLKNGRFKDAGIRTGVRAVDTFLLLPFNLAALFCSCNVDYCIAYLGQCQHTF